MTFTAPAFLPFLVAVLGAAALVGARRRWAVLLLASYGLYAGFGAAPLLLALAAVTGVSFGCALIVETRPDGAARNWILRAGVAGCLGVLVLGKLGAGAGLAAVGVSYFTLQAMAYLFDVRDRVVPAERHLGLYALYLAFFPKLVQGPIERAEALLPQLRAMPRLAPADLAHGGQLFLWGLFQKLVVADRLAPMVDAVYGAPAGKQGTAVVIATYLFAAQLYLDFSGYTDMALGIARMFGLRLTQNFRAPYAATSVADFWRRWHISFSSFLLDYVFRPLQLDLRDLRTLGTPLALLATFLVSGLWHGAAWSFVVWGLLHGVFLATSALTRPWRTRWQRRLGVLGKPPYALFQRVVTFHLVCLGWVFFRAATPAEAARLVGRALSGLPGTLARVARGEDLDALVFLGQVRGACAFALGMLVLAALLRPAVARWVDGTPEVGPSRVFGRPVVLAVLVYLVVFLGATAQSFVYQQF